MSSILEALKKAEKESPNLDFTPELIKVDTRKAVSRRARGTRVIHKVSISIVILVVAGFGIWFAPAYRDLLYKKTPDHQPGPPAMENSLVESSLDAAVAKPEIERTFESPKEMTFQPPDVKEARSVVEDVQELKPIRKQEFTAKQPPDKQKFTVKQPPEQLTEGPPEDAKLRLEAIVWAESPESRFAVINGQIIRVGGSMEGISITAIERDHVAARSSGREWKMKFTVD